MAVDWSKQHCGVRQASAAQVIEHMPDLAEVLETFPDDADDFSWDVKVHMLMPRQFPCIPHWHVDNVPRVAGVQRFERVDLTKPMYLWLSNGPLTQFTHGYIMPQCWHRFTQADQHRGTAAAEFGFRGFVRATHRAIMEVSKNPEAVLRRHTQVYLDSETYQW